MQFDIWYTLYQKSGSLYQNWYNPYQNGSKVQQNFLGKSLNFKSWTSLKIQACLCELGCGEIFSAHDFKGPIFRFFFWACTKIGTAWTKKVAAWWGPYQNLTNLDVFWFQNITNLDSFMFRSIVLFIFHSLVIDHHWVTLSISQSAHMSVHRSVHQSD